MLRETFEALLEPQLPSVRRLVYSRIRSADHADDVLQEALLHAFAHRHQLRTESNFKGWLLTIAFNEVRLHFRNLRPSISMEDFPWRDLVDGAPSPLVSYERRQKKERVHAGLAQLSPRDRTAIGLADFRGLTAEEAAREMSVSKAAFKSTHFRARQRLGEVLRKAA
jgi:RNA polymerase sigma factor (sigma-70 family)